MVTKILFLLSIILLTVSAFYFIKYKQEKTATLKARDRILILQQREELYNWMILKYSKLVTQIVPKNGFIVEDMNGNNHQLDSIITHRNVLVYRFKQDECEDCYSSLFLKLDSYNSSADTTKVIFLTTFSDRKLLQFLASKYQIKSPVYNVKNEYMKDMPLEILNQPYLFKINNGIYTDFLLPDRNLRKLTDLYLEMQ